MIKKQALARFISKYKHLPAQGSAAWHQLREGTVGGSELNGLLRNESDFVAGKIGLRKFPEGMLSCLWGTVLEELVRDVASRILKVDIYEASSVPSAEVMGKTYSMDGMGVVELQGRPAETTLFEFKVPWSRQIIQNEIYRDYIPQVLSGMSDLVLPETALYIEAVFRACRFEELCCTPWTETWFHRTAAPNQELPMAFAFIGFYVDEFVVPDDRDAWVLRQLFTTDGDTDFAKTENTGMITSILKYVKSGVVKRWNSRMWYCPKEFQRCDFVRREGIQVEPTPRVEMDLEVARFYSWAASVDKIPLGILGVKLVELNITRVAKVAGYTKQHEPAIHAALARVRTLNAIEDIGIRANEYNRIYKKKVEEPCADLDADLDAYIL
jgi:hypothetical protein